MKRMTEEQATFLELSVIRQLTYAQITEQTGIPRATLSKWWDDLKEEREDLSKIRQIWRQKCSTLDFWNFREWYTSADRKCHYCAITEAEIAKLIDKDRIITKRLNTRGKTLEIERLEPNKPYDDTDNLVFSCYWCNNAKTDEFTEQEFEPIGKHISNIWKSRLKDS